MMPCGLPGSACNRRRLWISTELLCHLLDGHFTHRVHMVGVLWCWCWCPQATHWILISKSFTAFTALILESHKSCNTVTPYQLLKLDQALLQTRAASYHPRVPGPLHHWKEKDMESSWVIFLNVDVDQLW